MEPRAFSGPRLAPPISDTAETATIPAPRGVDAPILQIVDQTGDLLGKTRQAPQEAHDDTSPRRNRNPPPLAAEPARTGIDIPAAPEPDHSHEYQSGEGAEHPEGHCEPDEHPELPILGERPWRFGFGWSTHNGSLTNQLLAIDSSSSPPRRRVPLARRRGRNEACPVLGQRRWRRSPRARRHRWAATGSLNAPTVVDSALPRRCPATACRAPWPWHARTHARRWRPGRAGWPASPARRPRSAD